MRFQVAAVTASLLSTVDFEETEDSFRLLRAWRDAEPGLFPERLDSQEPIRERIDPQRIEASRARQFGSTWYAARARPRLAASLDRGRASDHGAFKLYVFERAERAAMAARTARLIDALAVVAPPDYGMVHVLTGPEHREAMDPWRSDLTGDEEGAHASWGFTVQLQRGLPTLYWRNLFGLPYLELFGRDRLRSAPAFAAEERPWGVALQLTPEPPTDETYGAFREVRERVIDHLGRDAFGVDDPSGQPAVRVPTFQLDRPAGS